MSFKSTRSIFFRLSKPSGLLLFATTAILSVFGSPIHVDAQSVPAAKAKQPQARLEFLRRSRDQLQAAQDAAMQELAVLDLDREKLLKKQDAIGVSQESFADIVGQLQTQRVQMMIDLAGLDARREAVVALREELEGQTKKEVAEQISQLLKMEEGNLERVRKLIQRGVAPESELQAVEKKILELRIRLAESKQSSVNANAFNSALLNASLERAEKRARLEKVESLLEQFIKARPVLEKTDIRTSEIRKLKMRLDSFETQSTQISSELEVLRKELGQSEPSDR